MVEILKYAIIGEIVIGLGLIFSFKEIEIGFFSFVKVE